MQFLSLFLANYALTSPILVNLVSLEQFSNAYGFLLLVQGVSNLLGPPFAGFLYDVYKIWHYTFGLGGLFIVLSGLLLLILPCSRQVKLLRNQRLSQNKGHIKAKQDGKINSNGKSPVYVWKKNRSYSLDRLSSENAHGQKTFLALSQNKGQIKTKKDSKINSNGKPPAYVWKREWQKLFHGPLEPQKKCSRSKTFLALTGLLSKPECNLITHYLWVLLMYMWYFCWDLLVSKES